MRLFRIALISLITIIPLAADDENENIQLRSEFETVPIDEDVVLSDGSGNEIINEILDATDAGNVSDPNDNEFTIDAIEENIDEDAEHDLKEVSIESPNKAQHEQDENTPSATKDSPEINSKDQVVENKEQENDGTGARDSSEKSGNSENITAAGEDVAISDQQVSSSASGKEDDKSSEASTPSSSTGEDEKDPEQTKIPDTKYEDRKKPISVDYANKSTGALILDKSQNFQGTSNLLVNDKDKYAMIPCDDEEVKYVIIGLSEDILVKTIKLYSFERFSSVTKRFMVMGSQTYPAMTDWEDLGTFNAKPWYEKNKEQTFELAVPSWARYLKFRFLDHYGDEHYCTATQIKVHGSTTLQGFHEMQLLAKADEEKAEEAKADEAKAETREEEKSNSDDSNNTPAAKEESDQLDVKNTDLQNSDNKSTAVDSNMASDNAANLRKSSDAAESSVQKETHSDPGDLTSENSDNTENKSANPDSDERNITVDTDSNNGTDNINELSEVLTEGSEDIPNELPQNTSEHLESSDSANVNDGGEDIERNTEDALEENNASATIEVDTETQVEKEANDKGKNSIAENVVDEALTRIAADDIENGSDPSSSPTVLNAVNSAIRTAKQAASMTDDGKILNNLSTSGVHHREEGHANSEHTEGEAENIVVAANNEQEIVGKANDSPLKASTNVAEEEKSSKPAVNNDETDAEEVDGASSVDPVAPKHDNVTKVSSTKVYKDVVDEISSRYPGAKCLDNLNFSAFKENAINKKKGTQKKESATPLNQPIFKKLADEIKGLETSQGVYEEYINAVTNCYQRVILDLGVELGTIERQQEERLAAMEEQMLRLHEAQMNSRSFTLEDIASYLMKPITSVFDFALQSFPFLTSRLIYFIELLIRIIERILVSEQAQRFILLLKMYEHDLRVFVLGAMFCYIFVKLSRKKENTAKSMSNAKSVRSTSNSSRPNVTKRRKKKSSKGTDVDTDTVMTLQNIGSLNTDDESY
mmetsp:Transcript_27377/g.40468  ORF Transcript_27377/g.40468 Transcript_27377/m.40468 type:complete len:991 (-) Transcript_27377:56-3028(-)